MIQILRNSISLLNPGEKRKLVLLVFMNIVINLLDIFALACLVFLVSFFTQPNYSGHSAIIEWFKTIDPTLAILLFMIFFILKSIVGYLVISSQYSFVYATASRISGRNLLKYLNGTYHDFVNIDSSVMIRRISHEPIEFGQYVLQGLQQIFSESVLVIISLTAVCIYNSHLFLLLLFVLVPPVLILAYFSKRMLKTARRHVKNSSEKALQHLNEALSGYIESNIYGKKDFFTNRYSGFQNMLNRYLAHLQSVQSLPSRFMEVFAVAGFFILVIANKFYSHSAVIPIASIGAFMAAAYKIIPGLVKIQNLSGQVRTYNYTVDDLMDMSNVPKPDKKIPGEKIKSISFHNVSFKHKGRQVIDKFNFNIGAGEFIGISGSSGAGKSTILNLILGFLGADNGEIIINGSVMNATERQSFWPQIAYVKQQPFMIHDTILNNITLTEVDYDSLKLNDAVLATGLGELLQNSSDALQKTITESGKNISGGQRQRIALARAFYKDADLIILDEPFNELDLDSEQKILAHCRNLVNAGKMIVLISHHKSSLSFCDKVYQV